MSNVFVPIVAVSVPRRMFLQGGAALLGGAFLPDAFAALRKPVGRRRKT